MSTARRGVNGVRETPGHRRVLMTAATRVPVALLYGRASRGVRPVAPADPRAPRANPGATGSVGLCRQTAATISSSVAARYADKFLYALQIISQL